MKNKKKIIYSLCGVAIILVFITMVVILIRKDDSTQQFENNNENMIQLYYTNSNYELISRKIFIEWEKNSFQTNINYLLLKLQQIPVKDGEDIQKSIPDGITLERNNYNDINKSVEIDFNENYLQEAAYKQIICRTAIVQTLTQLPYVDSVKFYINGKPLMNSNGKPIGYTKSGDIVLNDSDFLVDGENYSVDLFFACKDTDGLKNEKRDIKVKSSDNIAKLVLDELIKGPTDNNLIATIPKDTVINDLLVKDGVCYVDLNKIFGDYLAVGNQQNLLTVYSIVNSLTELPYINQVQFLIDGAKQEDFKSDIEFNNLFSRNLDIIIKKEG